MGPVLRGIAMNYPPILFHPINSITAYKGQIIYDTPETEAKAQTPMPYLQWQPAPGVTRPTPAGLQLADWCRRRPTVPAPGRARGPVPDGADGPLPGPPPAAPAPAAPLPAERGPDDEADLVARHRIRGRRGVLLAGCQFGGLNSCDMPGTAGHGTGSYTITVEFPTWRRCRRTRR